MPGGSGLGVATPNPMQGNPRGCPMFPGIRKRAGTGACPYGPVRGSSRFLVPTLSVGMHTRVQCAPISSMG
jgi:hypothetical protein